MNNPIHHTDRTPGMVPGNVTLTQLPDGKWKASAPVGCLFGAQVEGECVGFGDTEQLALIALKRDQDDLFGGLWV